MATSSGKLQRKQDFFPRKKTISLLKWDYAEYIVGGNGASHCFWNVAPLRPEGINRDSLILEEFNALLQHWNLQNSFTDLVCNWNLSYSREAVYFISCNNTVGNRRLIV